jgi:hypothetical protein
MLHCIQFHPPIADNRTINAQRIFRNDENNGEDHHNLPF